MLESESVLAVEDGPIFAVLVSQVWLIEDLLLSVLRSHQVGVVFRLSALISPLRLFLPQLQKFLIWFFGRLWTPLNSSELIQD